MMDPMNPPVLNPDEPSIVGLKEAARLAGVSLSTAKRRRSDLIAAGAVQENSGRWRIPRAAVAVLAEPPVHSGSEPPYELPPEEQRELARELHEFDRRDQQAWAHAASAPKVEERTEADRLREELHTMEIRAVRAEVQAEERQRALDAAQEQVRAYLQLEAMRGLTAAREHEEADTPTEDVPAASGSSLSGWERFRRRFGRHDR